MNKLPFDIQKYIIDYVMLLEYKKIISIHPMLYIKLGSEYYYRPSVVDCLNNLIVNDCEYKYMIALKSTHHFNRYKVINNKYIKFISILISKITIFLSDFMENNSWVMIFALPIMIYVLFLMLFEQWLTKNYLVFDNNRQINDKSNVIMIYYEL